MHLIALGRVEVQLLSMPNTAVLCRIEGAFCRTRDRHGLPAATLLLVLVNGSLRAIAAKASDAVSRSEATRQVALGCCSWPEAPCQWLLA